MNAAPNRSLRRRPGALPAAQRGVSLIVVLVVVMLSMLLVLGGSRVAVLNESLASNDADYQRAFEAAQAMLADAELDLMGRAANGGPCVGAACRTPASPVFFPRDLSEYQDLEDRLRAAAVSGAPPCRNGICLDLGNQTSGDAATSFWDNPAGLDATWNNTRSLAAFIATETGFNRRAASYGQYTGAVAGATGNPLLLPAAQRAWYWVEVLRYHTAGAAGNFSGFWAPSASEPFVYRITAVAQGLKPGTQVVVQSTLVTQPQRRAPF
jgi:Tfp pilus assembly protein PilX